MNHGVDKPESIADHMYRMSLMAMVAAKEMPGLDQNRCVKLALIHDLAEAIVGDITPHDPVSKEEKAKMEADAMAKIRDMLGDSLGGEEVEALWHEYEDQVTDEAKLLKDLDKPGYHQRGSTRGRRGRISRSFSSPPPGSSRRRWDRRGRRRSSRAGRLKR